MVKPGDMIQRLKLINLDGKGKYGYQKDKLVKVLHVGPGVAYIHDGVERIALKLTKTGHINRSKAYRTFTYSEVD